MRSIKKRDMEVLCRSLVAAGCSLVHARGADDAIRRWNGALKIAPSLIVRCRSKEQVSAALRLTQATGESVSIHVGGQDWTGRSLRDGSVVLDLSDMNQVLIDARRREATIGGGVLAGQLNSAARKQGLVAVIGNDGAVGMAGLIMGGGYGPLMTRFGLACDNLLSAEVTLVDGRVVNCDADHEPDLFWALRGGGGNFGVVTAMRLRLHDLATVLVSNQIFPWRDARTVLATYAALMNCSPAELFGSAVLALGPERAPVVVVTLIWTGSIGLAAPIVAKMAASGNPVLAKTETIEAAALLSQTDGRLVQGRGYEVGTRWFADLSAAAIKVLIDGFEARTSSLSSIILHHCHGAATNVPVNATAFGQRSPHFTALLYGTWDPASADATAHRAWTARLLTELEPTALPGGYANLLPDTAAVQIADAYGSNYSRLATLKLRYDPAGTLRAIPLTSSARI